MMSTNRKAAAIKTSGRLKIRASKAPQAPAAVSAPHVYERRPPGEPPIIGVPTHVFAGLGEWGALLVAVV